MIQDSLVHFDFAKYTSKDTGIRILISRVSMFSLWPILAICALLTVVATLMCCMKYFPEPRWNEPHALGLPRNFYESANGPIKGMMEIIGQGESPWGHATFCVMSLVIALFAIFVVLQVAGYIHWN
jgi:hypothetical protein